MVKVFLRHCLTTFSIDLCHTRFATQDDTRVAANGRPPSGRCVETRPLERSFTQGPASEDPLHGFPTWLLVMLLCSNGSSQGQSGVVRNTRKTSTVPRVDRRNRTSLQAKSLPLQPRHNIIFLMSVGQKVETLIDH